MSEYRVRLLAFSCFVIYLFPSYGCTTTAPIHVWVPGQIPIAKDAKVALMPLEGDAQLAASMQDHLLAQRPAASANVAMFTAEQLANFSPVRLASTASLQSDHLALDAARTIGADVLIKGDVLAGNLQVNDEQAVPPTAQQETDWNMAFFRNGSQKQEDESLLLSWRIIDAASGQTLGGHTVNLNTEMALEKYPDLQQIYPDDPTQALVAASAREAWMMISPSVVRDEVELAKPWLQVGAWRVRRGVKAAKRGDWQTAEEQFERAAKVPFSAAAKHNLAIARAAREDFDGAKTVLESVGGPLAIRLPDSTLFWLDQRHQVYCEAHGFSPPTAGWVYPKPTSTQSVDSTLAVGLEDLPWWSAIPFVKPPGWTWRDWIRQPIVF